MGYRLLPVWHGEGAVPAHLAGRWFSDGRELFYPTAQGLVLGFRAKTHPTWFSVPQPFADLLRQMACSLGNRDHGAWANPL